MNVLAWPLPLLLSPFVGSFLGVLIRRLPARRPVATGRSACESCGRVLAPGDLVPLASYLFLRGRCRYCHAPIGRFHPAVELAAIAVAAWAVLAGSDPAGVWFDCLLGWSLLALGWIDWRHMMLPDALTLPLLLFGLAATRVLDPAALTEHAAAAAAGYLGFRALACGYRRLRGRDGLGEGDAKLMAAAGAWVGFASLSWVLLGGAMVGICAALVGRLFMGRAFTGATRIPFGPGLSLALWIVRLHEDRALAALARGTSWLH